MEIAFSSTGMVIPSVPWAPQQSVLDTALTERPLLVGTEIVQSPDLPLVTGHAERPVHTGHGLDPSFAELIDVEYLGPDQVVFIRCHVLPRRVQSQ